MNQGAFYPKGNTVLTAASSSTSSTVATQITTANAPAAHLSNGSTIPIYVAFGSSSVQAACPTTAVPATGLALQAGAQLVVCIAASTANNWCQAATSAGAALLFVTPGQMGL